MEPKRVLSTQQEQVIHLCHHDHQGVSVEGAADSMGISVKEVQRLLRSTRCIAPQLFPILTSQHRAILAMYDDHMSQKEIAAHLDITVPMLKRRVGFLRKHGFLRSRKMLRYRPSMDAQVKEKF